jgi:hypothetical protein
MYKGGDFKNLVSSALVALLLQSQEPTSIPSYTTTNAATLPHNFGAQHDPSGPIEAVTVGC